MYVSTLDIQQQRFIEHAIQIIDCGPVVRSPQSVQIEPPVANL
jgi:hypothetical protein